MRTRRLSPPSVREGRLIDGGARSGALVLLAFIGLFASAGAQPVFEEIALEAGLDISHIPAIRGEPGRMSGGAAAEDFDGDGWIDLFFVQGHDGPCALFMNQGDGTFQNEAAVRGADLTGDGMAATAADYDNDGDVDVVVTFIDPSPVLLVNDGTGSFTANTTMLRVTGTNWTSASFGDIDNDGYLDLLLARWSTDEENPNLILYSNDGNGWLHPIPIHFSGYHDILAFSPRFADVNSDGYQDLLSTCDFSQSQVYLNTGGRLFRRWTEAAGTGSDQNGMGSTVADFDNDGDLDWFITSIFDDLPEPPGEYNWGKSGNRLFMNRGDATFDDRTTTAGVRHGFWGWGATAQDFDLDGDLDILHVNGWPDDAGAGDHRFDQKPARLFLNDGTATFVEGAQAAGIDDPGQGRGVAAFDYDNDGDQDALIVNNSEVVFGPDIVPFELRPAPLRLYRNDTLTTQGGEANWLKVSLAGTPPLHRHGIGSRVVIETSGTMQLRELHASTNFMAQDMGRIAHFGLGSETVADRIRTSWPDGSTVSHYAVEANQHIVIPSAAAAANPRRMLAGGTVSLTAPTAVEGLQFAHWEIDGSQEASRNTERTYVTPGSHEAIAFYVDPGTDTVRRTEAFLVDVVDPPAGWMPR